jgi:hypothetical protein
VDPFSITRARALDHPGILMTWSHGHGGSDSPHVENDDITVMEFPAQVTTIPKIDPAVSAMFSQ